MVLVAQFINSKHDEIDWQKVVGYAERFKMTRLVYFVLKLLRELLAANVPEKYIQHRITGYDYLSKLVVAGFFQGEQRAHLKMLAYIYLLDSPLDVIAVAINRVFPSVGEIRLRYDISQDETLKTALYYFLNPVFLLFRKR